MARNRPRSRSLGKSSAVGGLAFVVLGIFFALGPIVATALSSASLRATAKASESWVPTPCTVVLTAADARTAGEMHWSWEGRPYSTRELQLASSDSEAPLRLPDAWFTAVPAHEPVCYVNPEDPSQAVLLRGLRPESAAARWALRGSVALAFLVGLGLAVWGWRKMRIEAPRGRGPGSSRRATASRNDEESNPGTSSPSHRLQPAATPATRSLFWLGIALFWYVCLGVLALAVDAEYEEPSSPPPAALVALIAAALGGLVFLAKFLGAATLLRLPHPRLELSKAFLTPGESAQLRWDLSDPGRRLDSISIDWLGQETVSYQLGESREEESHVFQRTPVLDPIPLGATQGPSPGSKPPTTIQWLPHVDQMHTFVGANNRVEWFFEVTLEARMGRAFVLRYPVDVEPR